MFRAGVSMICTLLLMSGFPIERAVTDLLGEAKELGHPPFDSIGCGIFLLLIGYFGCGWIIGSGF